MKFAISVSITDFSLAPQTLEPLFKGLEIAGSDGLEIVVGVKSRWKAKQLLSLSKKYNLAIKTLHQPIWSGGGIWLDEGFIELAKRLSVKAVVIHPPLFVPINSSQGKKYFETLAKWQTKYNVQLLLENAQSQWRQQILTKLIPIYKETTELISLATIAKQYEFFINYDSSHARLIKPQVNKPFQEILPAIKNIHLSSFNQKTDHLPLHMGNFDTKGFITYLYKKNYSGLITLEIFYPKSIQWVKYDFAAIKKSIEIIKSITP